MESPPFEPSTEMRKAYTKISSGIKDRILGAAKHDSRRPFRFFDLPPGVRNEIYHCLFGNGNQQSCTTIPLIKHKRGKGERIRSLLTSDKHSWSTRSLLLVSRQMFKETAGYVWRDAHATLFDFEDTWGKDRGSLLKAIEGGRVPQSIASLKKTMLNRLASVRWLELSRIDTLYFITRMPGEQIGQYLAEDLLDWWMPVQLTAAAASLAEARAMMPQLDSITVSDACFDDIPPENPQWLPFLLPAGPLGARRLKETFPGVQHLRLVGSHGGQTYCANQEGHWYKPESQVRVEGDDDWAGLERLIGWRKQQGLCPALWSDH